MAKTEQELKVDGLVFVWHLAKAAENRKKHGVSFEEAATVFADPLARVRVDESRPHAERRMQILGYSLFGRLLLVVHVEVHDETRDPNHLGAPPRSGRSPKARP